MLAKKKMGFERCLGLLFGMSSFAADSFTRVKGGSDRGALWGRNFAENNLFY